MKIRALGDSVLFEFVDESKGGMFAPKLSDTRKNPRSTADAHYTDAGGASVAREGRYACWR